MRVGLGVQGSVASVKDCKFEGIWYFTIRSLELNLEVEHFTGSERAQVVDGFGIDVVGQLEEGVTNEGKPCVEGDHGGVGVGGRSAAPEEVFGVTVALIVGTGVGVGS